MEVSVERADREQAVLSPIRKPLDRGAGILLLVAGSRPHQRDLVTLLVGAEWRRHHDRDAKARVETEFAGLGPEHVSLAQQRVKRWEVLVFGRGEQHANGLS